MVSYALPPLSILPRGTQTLVLHVQRTQVVKPGKHLWTLSALSNYLKFGLTGSRSVVTKEMQDLVALVDLFQLVLIMAYLRKPLIDLIIRF